MNVFSERVLGRINPLANPIVDLSQDHKKVYICWDRDDPTPGGEIIIEPKVFEGALMIKSAVGIFSTNREKNMFAGSCAVLTLLACLDIIARQSHFPVVHTAFTTEYTRRIFAKLKEAQIYDFSGKYFDKHEDTYFVYRSFLPYRNDFSQEIAKFSVPKVLPLIPQIMMEFYNLSEQFD